MNVNEICQSQLIELTTFGQSRTKSSSREMNRTRRMAFRCFESIVRTDGLLVEGDSLRVEQERPALLVTKRIVAVVGSQIKEMRNHWKE